MKVPKFLTLSILFFPLFFKSELQATLPTVATETRTSRRPLSGNLFSEKEPPRPEDAGGSRVRVDTGSQSLPWDKLYEKEPPRKEDAGGSRSAGEEICSISPESLSGETIRLWSDRPLFLWRGNLRKIEVRLHRSNQVLWSYAIANNNKSALYEGAPLQPGKDYDWLLFEEDTTIPVFQVSFQVLPAQERDRITAELNQLEAKLKQEGATPEKIAYERARYFAAQQMWPDVFQSAYEVKNPSATLTQFIQAIPQRFCSSSAPS